MKNGIKETQNIVLSKAHLRAQIERVYRSLPMDYRVNMDALESLITNRLHSFYNPNVDRFLSALLHLPKRDDVTVSFLNSGTSPIVKDEALLSSLMALRPWRKGPFTLDGICIDSEWQSNMKWDRFQDYFSELTDRRILDIGCGNGYYMFRMLEHDPRFVLGIDPSDLTYFQYHAIQNYVDDDRLHYLPIGWNDLDPFSSFFDVVFCMGIMYHHRSPVDLFKTIRSVSTDKVTLFFDTLIIDGEDDVALFPQGRYAQMPNVYFIPTLSCLKNMMLRAGFKTIDVVSIDKTTSLEQRVTPWTYEQSLSDFLDSEDLSKTVEGYPAPRRVALVCTNN